MNLLQRGCVPVPASTNIRSVKLTRLVTQDVRQLLETVPCAIETHMQPRITALTGFGVSQPVLFIPYPGWLPTRPGSSCLRLAIGILQASSLLPQEGCFLFAMLRVSFPLKRSLRAVGLDVWILDSSEHHSVAILRFSFMPVMKGMRWLKVSSQESSPRRK